MTTKIQIIIAIILVCFGVILIIVAFIVPPAGIIDPSVLTAYGETLTFSGSLVGLDYHYRAKSINYKPYSEFTRLNTSDKSTTSEEP